MAQLVHVPRVVRHKRAPEVGAIIGYGAIAEKAHLPALEQCGLHIVAIVEPNEQRQAAAKRRLPQAKVYRDVSEMLACETLDFVDICTPPHLHFEAAKLALEHGLDVLCEKPLVLTRAHGKILGTLARAQNRTLVCMHNWTQAPIIRRACELAAAGELGLLSHVDLVTLRTKPAQAVGADADWRTSPKLAGGGILFDHGWHALSIMLQLHQRTPKSVWADCWQERFLELAVEDSVELSVKFLERGSGRFLGTWAANRRENRIHLLGSQGSLHIVNDTLTLERNTREPLKETFSQSLADGGYRSDWTAAQVRAFVDEAGGRIEPHTGLYEALTTLEIITSAYRSAQADGAGRTVAAVLPP